MKLRALSVAITLASIAAPLGLTATTAAAQTPPSVHQGMFSSMVVFGDSFSDGGNFALALELPEISRFTTNPGHVAVENIASFLGLPLLPSLQGGGNYAIAYAGMGENPPDTPPFVVPLPAQLEASLAASGGRADPHTLYTIVGGSNDVFGAFTLAGMGVITPAEAQAMIDAAAHAELGMIERLGQAGARYVMVFNLPDLGLSPDIAALGPDVAGQLTEMTVAYNQALAAGLANTGVNLIPVNLFGLFNEFVADPARYGFSDMAMPACGMEAVAIECGPQGSGAPYTYAPGAENTHLFADFAHPGSAAHAMLAQYAESIILAPGQISLLGEAPLAIRQGVDRSLRNRIAARAAGASGNDWQAWADYGYARQRLDAQVNSPQSRNDLNQFTIGADVHPGEALSVGLAFTASRQNNDFAGGMGSFKLRDLMLSGYAAWQWSHAYVGASASIGDLDFSDIRRDIAIGPSLRHERGDSSGSHSAFTLGGGGWFDLHDWKTGPYAELAWQRIRVDGYAEAGNDAATMRFGQQTRRSLVGTLGWQVVGSTQAGNTELHPWARIAWNRDNDADPREVSAGLVSMPGRFALPGFVPDKSWGSVGIGVSARFTPEFSGWIGYDGRYSDASQRIDSLSLGLALRF